MEANNSLHTTPPRPLCRRNPHAQDSWDAASSLKEYLGYAADLEDYAWYEEHFPEDLQLRHAFAVFAELTS